jgi:hypothetical protein
MFFSKYWTVKNSSWNLGLTLIFYPVAHVLHSISEQMYTYIYSIVMLNHGFFSYTPILPDSRYKGVDCIHINLTFYQEYPVFLYFHQSWTDDRLAGKLNHSLTLTGEAITSFWRPDPYCYNARISNLMAEDKNVRSRLTITTNGEMFYSRGYVAYSFKECSYFIRFYQWARIRVLLRVPESIVFSVRFQSIV